MESIPDCPTIPTSSDIHKSFLLFAVSISTCPARLLHSSERNGYEPRWYDISGCFHELAIQDKRALLSTTTRIGCLTLHLNRQFNKGSSPRRPIPYDCHKTMLQFMHVSCFRSRDPFRISRPGRSSHPASSRSSLPPKATCRYISKSRFCSAKLLLDPCKPPLSSPLLTKQYLSLLPPGSDLIRPPRRQFPCSIMASVQGGVFP